MEDPNPRGATLEEQFDSADAEDPTRAYMLEAEAGHLFRRAHQRAKIIFAERIGTLELTPRQFEILDLMSQGLTNKEIARRIGLSDGTIRAHVAAIFRNLGVRNRLQATRIYFEELRN